LSAKLRTGNSRELYPYRCAISLFIRAQPYFKVHSTRGCPPVAGVQLASAAWSIEGMMAAAPKPTRQSTTPRAGGATFHLPACRFIG